MTFRLCGVKHLDNFICLIYSNLLKFIYFIYFYLNYLFRIVCIFRTLDPSLAESVSSLIWVAPHIQADVCEMKIISDQLTRKFGKKYMEVNIMY